MQEAMLTYSQTGGMVFLPRKKDNHTTISFKTCSWNRFLETPLGIMLMVYMAPQPHLAPV